MYTLQASTELFKTHKAAQVLSDQSSFRVLQTSSGQSLFFGIGDSNLLYLSAEQDNTATGWTPIDLTTELAGNFPGQTISAKGFAVRQSASTGNVLLVQIIHVAETNTDVLYALVDLSNAADAAWMQAPTSRSWVARPYDATQKLNGNLELAYVELPVSDDPAQAPNLVAGVRDPATGFVQNFLVNLHAAQGAWTILPAGENFDALNDLAIGKPQGALVPGLYQLATLNNKPSLTFTPWKGLYGAPPDVTVLTPPAGASSIATAATTPSGSTDLYVAGTGGIYLYAAGSQSSNSAGVQIIAGSIIADVESLEVHVAGELVSIWGRTGDGQIFYSHCPLGSQTDPNQWSAPIPIQNNVDQLSSMLDLQTQSHVLYAHTAGQQVVKLAQDPVTTAWRTQSMLLPSLDVNDVVEIYAYTTRIAVVDENNLPLPGQAFVVTAKSPCSVYIDDAYVRLPAGPYQVQADASGTVSIVQETNTLGAVCYDLTQGDGSICSVNPMSIMVQRLSGIRQGSDLTGISVTDEFGNTTPLIDPNNKILSTNSGAVAQGIAQFVAMANSMPQDGSSLPLPSGPAAKDRLASTPDLSWGMTFGNGMISYYGPEQMARMGLTYDQQKTSLKTESIQLDDINDALGAVAGDVLSWIRHEFENVQCFFIHLVDGVTNFFIQIGQDLYHFVIRCMNDVAQAIQVILQAIEVDWEKLVQWLGFIFLWKDILRTHQVLKSIFKQFANYAASSIGSTDQALQSAFASVQDDINQWAGLPTMADSAGSLSSSGQKPAGCSSPQAHYGTSQAKHNIGGAQTDYTPAFGSGDVLQELLTQFQQMLQQEKDTFTHAYETLKTDVVDQIANLSINDLIKRLLDIVFTTLLQTVETAARSAANILAILVQGATDVLDQPLKIPVLSWLYSYITDGEGQLSALDLGCLIVAIPVTIVVKLETGSAPFADDTLSSAIINANDFSSIRQLYNGPSPSANEQRRSMAVTGLPGGSPSPAAILNLTGSICAYFGAIGVVIFGTVKFANATLMPVAVAYAVAYLPFVGPDVAEIILTDENPTWDVKLNNQVTVMSVAKTFVDISLCRYVQGESSFLLEGWNLISPAAEAFINLVWQIPACAALIRGQSPAAVAGFLANTAFDAGGWLTPGTSYPPSEEIKGAFFSATLVCTALYGELSLIQGFLAYNSAIAVKSE